MKIRLYTLLSILVTMLSSSSYANNQKPDLPDFSIYNDTPTKEKPKSKQTTNSVKPIDNVPSIANQGLTIKTQEIPQYVLDMMDKNGANDISTLANESAKKKLEAAQKAQKKQEQQNAQNARLMKEKAEAEAESLKRQKQEEAELQRALLAEQYRVFEHRPQYDPRSIETTDPIHKQSYGPNNQHLPVFIDLYQYSQYLFLMTMEENIPAINDLLHRGADINARDVKNHYTPLMYAVQNYKSRSTDYLINKGASLDLQDSKGRTALHIAAIHQNIDAINGILAMKASVETCDATGNRAAVYFPSMSDTMALKFVDLYTDPNLALLDFSRIGRFIAMQEAIKQGADIDARDADGNTPLIAAVEHKNPQLVALLLQRKPNMHLTNKAGVDALMAAQIAGDEYIWTLLKTHIDKAAIADNPDVLIAPTIKPTAHHTHTHHKAHTPPVEKPKSPTATPAKKVTKPISLLPKKS